MLVLGSTGGVGLSAVQLAKALGARVLAGVSNSAKSSIALQAGADDFIDLSAANLRDSLRDEVFAKNGGMGVDIVIDPIGGDAFDAALRALAWRGRLVVIGFASGRIPSVKANYLLVKNIEVSGLQVSDYRKRTPDLIAQCMQEIFAFFEAGKLVPAAIFTYPLESFAHALQQVVDRRVTGRVVLLPNLDSSETCMPFRYDEIGDRLKAYRLGSGLSADEIASQLGISRTALYRFEKGELAKIETIERLAEFARRVGSNATRRRYRVHPVGGYPFRAYAPDRGNIRAHHNTLRTDLIPPQPPTISTQHLGRFSPKTLPRMWPTASAH